MAKISRALAIVFFGLLFALPSHAKKCLHVDSYHAEYDWSAGIAQGLKESLGSTCDLTTIYMDTKRNQDLEFARKKGLEVKELIEKQKPDIVIVSDDNAAKWVLLPHFKDSKTPFVFVGLNWSIEAYKLPFKNTTGVIEIAPIEALSFEIKKALKSAKSVAWISIDTETERKEVPFVAARFKSQGLELKELWAKDMAEWKKKYVEAQEQADVVYFGNNIGAPDWNEKEAAEWAKQHQKKVSVGTYEWLLPYVSFVIAKSPIEQGALGASMVKEILAGKQPKSIPVTANKQYIGFVNKELQAKSGVTFSDVFMRNAKSK